MKKVAFSMSCFQWFKDTNLKANHNEYSIANTVTAVVSNGIKDTNLKANHNILAENP